jgi:hypothetical protein
MATVCLSMASVMGSPIIGVAKNATSLHPQDMVPRGHRS